MREIEPNIKDYEKAYSKFRWEVPEYYNFAWDTFDKWTEDRTKLALVTVESDGETFQKHSYWDLAYQSKKLSKVMMELGIKKEDRVMVFLPRIPEFYIVMLGLIRIGAVPMPTPTLSTAKDVHYRVNKAEATAVVSVEEYAERVEEIQEDMPTLKIKILADGDRKGWEPMKRLMRGVKGDLEREECARTHKDDPFLIFFTSGTESYPKMVLHTHSYPIGHYATSFMVQDIHPTDLMWAIADTGWAKAAWGKFYGQFTLGAAVLQYNQKGRFDPKIILKILQSFGVTVFCAPPTAYRMLILEKEFKRTDFSSLRHALSAGEPLNPEVIKVWKEVTGLDIYDYYGQTETVAILGNSRAFPIKYGSMGKPTIGHTVRIVDNNGSELPPGREGNIALKIKPVRPPGLMKEYWKNPQANEMSFIGEWYFTGDRAYMDKDGYFWFVGRADDVIKTSGYRVSPFEVESVLVEHPAVAEAAVIGVPDKLRGQILKACIILAPGYYPSKELAEEIQSFVRETTAPYKYPRLIEFVHTLPKTISGKIQRKLVRKISEMKRDNAEDQDPA